MEVDITGNDGKAEDKKSEAESASLKILPPWMITENMINLTKEQRGEVKQETKMDGSSSAAEASDDKKSITEDEDKKKFQVCGMIYCYFLVFICSAWFSTVLRMK